MRNLIGEFLSITVTALIAAAFSTILLAGAFNLLFPIYWALGLAGWIYIMTRRYPVVHSAVVDLGQGIVAMSRWRPKSPSSIPRVTRFKVESEDRRCPYCNAIVGPSWRKCPNCAASL
jgi:hypothetical protein